MTASLQLDVRDEIIAANQHYMKTFELGNVAFVARLYTEDGQLLPPNIDFIRSRQAIEKF